MGQGLTPLVGRSRELQELRSAHIDVSAGQGRMVLLGAEAGGGKTALAQAFFDGLDPTTPRGTGRAVNLGDQGAPLLPLRSALVDLTGRTRAAATDASPRTTDPEALAGADYDRLITSSLAALSAESTAGSVLLVEDVQWADPATLGFLELLADRLAELPLLVIVTFHSDIGRGHPLRSIIARLARTDGVTRVDLAPLSRDDVAGLYALLRDEPIDRLSLDLLMERTGGNPFFVREIIETGSASAAMPSSVEDGLAHRLEQLPTGVLRLARVVALAGRLSAEQLWELLGGSDPAATEGEADSTATLERFGDAIRAAVEANVLVADGDDLSFRHALAAEAIQQTMLPFEARAIHRRLAEQQERHGPGGSLDGVARAAHHWRLAGESERALVAAATAARLASDGGYHGALLQNLSMIIDLWESVDEPERVTSLDRIALLLQAADAAIEVGRPDEAVRLAAAAHGAAADDSRRRAGTAWRYAYARYAARQLDEAWDLVSREAARVIDEPPTPEYAELLVATVGMGMSVGEYQVGIDCDQRILDAVDQVDSPVAAGRLLSFRGACLAAGGEVMTGLRMLEHAVEHLADADDLGFAANAALNRVTAGLGVDPLVSLLTRTERALDRLSDAPPSRIAALYGAYGELLYLGGRYRDVWDLYRAGSTRFAWRTAAERALTLATLALDSSEADTAVRLSRSADLAAASGNPPMALRARIVAARVTAIDDRTAAARQLLQAVTEAAPVSVLLHGALALTYVWGWRAEDDADAGADADGLAGLEQITADVLALSARVAPDSPIGGWRAQLAAAMNRRDPAGWLEAIAICEAGGMAHDQGRAILGAASAHLAEGNRTAAAAMLADGRLLAAATDAPMLLAQLSALERRAGLDRGAASQRSNEAVFGLTDREQEVLRLVADGRTNREIGDRLFIAAKTVSVHVSNILRKLGVANRREAARLARDLGLGPTGP